MRQAGLRGITRAKGPPTTIPCREGSGHPPLLTGPFAPSGQISCGSPTSRTAGRSQAGSTPPSSSTCSAGGSSAGSYPPACAPIWPSTRWKRSVDSPARRPPDQRAHPPLGQGSSVRRSALHPAPRGGRRGRLGRVDRRFLRHSLAEAFNSLFNAELVRKKRPWKNIDDFEIAVAEYIDWFNHRRLHGGIGTVPPAELEQQHYRHHHAPATAGASLQTLH